MALRYEIDPTGPDGTVLAIDDDSGMRRVVWDPDVAKTLNPPAAAGSATSVDQASGAPLAPPPPAAGQTAPIPGTPIPGQGAPVDAPPDAASQQWQAAQDLAAAQAAAPSQPVPASVLAARAAPPGAPPTPAGTVLKKAELTPGTPGIPYDKAAEEARNDKLLDRNLELSNRQNAEQAIRNEQTLELNKQRLQDQAAQKVEADKSARYEAELNGVVRKELDPSRILQGNGSAILGLVGMAAAAFGKNPGLAMSRMNASLDRRISQDVQIQREQKDSMVSMLTRQLGSAQQAEAHYRASVRGLALDKLQAQLDNMGVANKYGDLMQAGRDEVATINDQAKTASFGKPGTAKYEFDMPKPGKGAAGGLTPGQSAFIGSLPEGAEKYQETELAKLATGRGQKPDQLRADWAKWNEDSRKNASTRQAITDVQAVIKPYEKDGDVPGKGLIVNNFPQWAVSEEGRNVRQRLGLAEAYLLHDLSGAAVSPEELKRIHSVVEGTGTYDDLKNGLNTIQRVTSAANRELDASNASFARIRDKTNEMVASEQAKADKNKQAQANGGYGAKGAEGPPVALPAPDEPLDPVRDVKRKGVSRALIDAFGSGGEAPGSAM